MCSSSEGVRTICDPNDSVQLEAQAQLYQDILAACYIDNPGVCTAFLTWGFTDALTWLDVDGGRFYPLPFDENGEKKEAYWSMYNLLASTADGCNFEWQDEQHYFSQRSNLTPFEDVVLKML